MDLQAIVISNSRRPLLPTPASWQLNVTEQETLSVLQEMIRFIRSYDGYKRLNLRFLCRDAQMIMEDIKRTISELEQESSLPAVGVELVDNELATLYMNSKKSEVNF